MADEAPKPPQRGLVPDTAFDRVIEALVRSKEYLVPEAQRELSELWDLDTLFALAVLLLVWGGFSLFTPLGWVVDLALGLIGAVAFGRDLLELGQAAAAAVDASDDAQLDAAAKRMAAGITAIGIDTILAVLTASAFRGIRGRLQQFRGKYSRKASPTRQRFVDIAGLAGGAGAGLVINQPEFRQTGGAIRSALNIGLPVAGFGLLIYGAYRLSRRSKG